MMTNDTGQMTNGESLTERLAARLIRHYASSQSENNFFSFWESSISIFGFVFHGLLFWKHPLVKDTGYKNAARFFSVKDN
jgi:hypothetical protein